jgi:hypothetical protein
MNPNESDNQGCCRRWATVAAVLAACLIFAALVWVTKKYTQPAPLNANRAAERADAFKKLTEENAVALNEAGWIDPTKGIVRLPIAVAMNLAEREWQNPAQARSNLIARVEKATALPPKAPEKPSAFE